MIYDLSYFSNYIGYAAVLVVTKNLNQFIFDLPQKI